MSGVEVVTFGCRLNLAEGEAMRALAANRSDLVIVNSCAVTAEAVKQARQAIRRAARRRPDARIVVTGCAAQIEPARFAAMPEVAAVIGNRDKRDAAAFAHGATTIVSDVMRADGATAPLPAGIRSHARGFVEVQTGCDHRCTFCVIPFARGPSRSLPAGAVVDRVKALVDDGCNEVVLTGVDTASYGPDLPGAQTLGHLVERILALVPRLPRLRLSSLDSVEIDERLCALLTGEPRIQPHLHLSLQAGDDRVLKRMRRRHSRADAVETVARIKAARPEVAIGADLIAGFPTETDAQAVASLQLIEDCDIVFAHVFPYSPRAGTPAARMPQVDAQVARARAAALRAAAAARRARWLDTLIGTEQSVLIERADGRGHTGAFAEARLTGGADGHGNRPRRGDVVTMRVTSRDGDMLTGDLR